MSLKEDLRKWFNPSHPEGGWKRINSKGEAIGPCAREPGEPKPKCMSNEKRASLSKKERASAVAAKRRHDPVADRSGKGGKPVNVSNFGKGKLSEEMEQLDEKNVPTNPSLWSRAKSLARSKFDVYPSAYANGWAAKWYKSKGGGWKSVSEEVELDEAMGKIKVKIKDSKPSAADKIYSLQQAIRKQKGLPDPSEYKKKLDAEKKMSEQHINGRFYPTKPRNVRNTPTASPRQSSDSADVRLKESKMTWDDMMTKDGPAPKPSRKAEIVRSAAKKKTNSMDQFQANPILDSDVNPQTNKQ